MARSFADAVKSGDISLDKKETPPPVVEEPDWFMPGSKSEAAVRGFASGATFGLAPKISAGIRSLFGDEKFSDLNKEYVEADKAAAAAHPGISTAANLAASAPSIGKMAAGTILRQVGKGALAGGVGALGSATTTEELPSNIALGAGSAGALTAALPMVGKAVQYGMNRGVTGAIDKGLGMVKEMARDGDKVGAARMMGLNPNETQMIREQAKSIKEASGNMFSKDPTALRPADMGQGYKNILEAGTPTWRDTAKSGATTLIGSGVSGLAGAGAASVFGDENIDPLTAGLITAAGSAPIIGRQFLGKLGSTVSNKIATSELPENVVNYIGRNSDALSRANTVGAQAISRDFSGWGNMPQSPFGKLSSYLEGIQNLDESMKRKHMMELQSTVEGRDATNDDTK